MAVRQVIDQKIGQIGSDITVDTINAELDHIHDRLNSTVTKGDIFISRVSVKGAYVMNGTDSYVGVDTAVGASTITLPSADDAIPNRIYMIKDEGASSSTNHITVLPFGSELIDRVASLTIQSQSEVLRLFFTGTEWFTL